MVVLGLGPWLQDIRALGWHSCYSPGLPLKVHKVAAEAPAITSPYNHAQRQVLGVGLGSTGALCTNQSAFQGGKSFP